MIWLHGKPEENVTAVLPKKPPLSSGRTPLEGD